MKRLLAVLILAASQAHAQTPTQACQPWEAVKKRFADQFKEHPVSSGLAGDRVMMVVASEHGRTFTVFLIDRAGIACAMASGHGWEPGHNPVPEINL